MRFAEEQLDLAPVLPAGLACGPCVDHYVFMFGQRRGLYIPALAGVCCEHGSPFIGQLQRADGLPCPKCTELQVRSEGKSVARLSSEVGVEFELCRFVLQTPGQLVDDFCWKRTA